MGFEISLSKPPKRIISLVPSQTELLSDLGLDEEVVGITKFCVHPHDKFQSKPKIGGTKKLNFEKIKELNPDLIIGNKEENEKEQILELKKHYSVWMSDIHNLDDALEMILKIGDITNANEKAQQLIKLITNNFAELNIRNSKFKIQRAAYLIWKSPYMSVGKDTFIDNMLSYCNLKNVFSSSSKRYPEISEQDLKDARPDIILLSSEPYPFKEKHIKEFSNLYPGVKVVIVDGEMFSWYGSRLQFAPAYFLGLRKQL